jgi:hypothetical protein
VSFPLLNAEVPALTTDAPIWMSEGTNEPVLLRAFTRVATGEALIDPIGLCLCPSSPLWSSCRVSCSVHLVLFFFFFLHSNFEATAGKGSKFCTSLFSVPSVGPGMYGVTVNVGRRGYGNEGRME